MTDLTMVEEAFDTDRTDLAAFAIANGYRRTAFRWDESGYKATFTIEGRADDIRAAFLSEGHNVNIKDYITARNMLMDMIKQSRR